MKDEPDLAGRYEIDRARIDPYYVERFVQLSADDDTHAFLRHCKTARASRLRGLAHSALTFVMSHYDANGWLDLYPLFVLSTGGWRTLLGEGDASLGHLVDVGAGNGDVTDTLRPLARSVRAYETSRAMARRLRRRGYPTSTADVTRTGIAAGADGVDTVALLNVLDRCARPRTLLKRVAESFSTDAGRLLLSLPLPLKQCFYDGATSREPLEALAFAGDSLELQWPQLAGLLGTEGFKVERWARVPYLSAGDRAAPFYVLDAVVAVARLG